MKLSQLNEDQKAHLAWRLDHKTACGLGHAASVARGEQGDLDLVTIFERYGMCSPRSAQAHARLTENFKADPSQKRVAEMSFQINRQIWAMVREANLTGAETRDLYQSLVESLKGSLRLYKVIDWEKVREQDEEENHE